MGQSPQSILQLALFENPEAGSISQTALYDLAPRFVYMTDRQAGSSNLNSIKREFEFLGEMYRLTVSPARIVQKDGTERDELPGAREQYVEDVVRKFAADKLHLGEQDEVMTGFSVYGICKELAKHKHTFSHSEVREALEILNQSNIHITKVVAEGEKKPKPVVSASAFPVLYFKDENDPDSQTRVQFNPLLAQAIKSLAFEQVNYEWMMQIKGPLPRYLFKRMSLMLADPDKSEAIVEIKASEIVSSFGQSRKRLRETLSEVEKAVGALKDIAMISEYTKIDVKEGRKKVDILFSLKFSDKFLADRKEARDHATAIKEEAMKHVGTKKPTKFIEITERQANVIKLDRKRIGKAA